MTITLQLLVANYAILPRIAQSPCYDGPERDYLRLDAHVYWLRAFIFDESTYWGNVYGTITPWEAGLPEPDQRQTVMMAAVRLVALQAISDKELIDEENLAALELLSEPSKYVSEYENKQVAIAREQFLIRFVKVTEVPDDVIQRVIVIFGREEVLRAAKEHLPPE